MADYNIYIHSVEGGGDGSQPGESGFSFTKPWGSDNEQGDKEEAAQLAKSTPNFIADAKKTMTAAKASPIVAVAFAAVKLTYSISKIITEFNAIKTGDFRTSNMFHDYEAAKNAIFHPISTTLQMQKTILLNRIENQRREMQRELLGDSDINRYSNRGF